MNFASCRFCTALTFVFFALLVLTAQRPVPAQASSDAGTVPDIPGVPNRLTNADFECNTGGYYEAQNSRGKRIQIPNQWTMFSNGDTPDMKSTRYWVTKACDPNSGAHVEKISGIDSFFIASLDIETPPEPGKPFDVSIYQQAPAITGTAYSLSGWLLTLCGGSNTVPRNDCPEGYYMAKMLGIDPTGGTDPNAPSVVWAENRKNFVDSNNQRIGWSNVRTSAVAEGEKITVFARIDSPFRWHGNHGFIDALSLVVAPVAALDITTTTAPSGRGLTVKLAWDGAFGPDIPTIAGGNYRLLYDVEYRYGAGAWRELQDGYAGAGSMDVPAVCTGEYQFRIRARAEQPEGEQGSWPNQRFPGVWEAPVSVVVRGDTDPIFAPLPAGAQRVYLPLLAVFSGC
jgi:hypothetical protein